MAEIILRDMVKKRGLADKFLIASSATSTEEIYGDVGNPVYPPAREELRKHGLSSDGKRAVQLKRSDYGYYDYLIAMDDANVRNIYRIVDGDPDCKVSKLMDHTSRKGNVADPWYSGDFATTYKDIYEGCECLLNEIIG
jgi:protein-tyrosine phosphatase